VAAAPGFQSKALITESGLTLGDLESYPRIDVTIDGADECVPRVGLTGDFGGQRAHKADIVSLLALPFRVDNALNSIKGGGACQLREKVLAEAADTCVWPSRDCLEKRRTHPSCSPYHSWVIVADYRKNSEVLGTSVRPPLPLGCHGL
jgi:ribose 5-phosphate isomerase A